MTVTLVVGAQWGDEGKGKITDMLAEEFDCVARYQGGDNAGHTVVRQGKKYKLHFIPSGILYKDTYSVMGNGMVINLVSLNKEIDELKDNGLSTEGLKISDRAFTILPTHINQDKKKEVREDSIGTTCKGIGPAYLDKIYREGIRIGDFFDEDIETKLSSKGLTKEEIEIQLKAFDKIKDYVCDTVLFLNKQYKSGKEILLEGAQAVMLDIDFGTYPYVTSSSPSSGGGSTGTGLPPTSINRIIGITKAYSTRVGKGPYPTELTDEIGENIRQKGGEFGTTTGRPRRCGWLDLPALKYALMVSGATEIAIMKIDVLSNLKEIKVAAAYKINNEYIDYFPSRISVLDKVECEYKIFKGWNKDIAGVRKYEDLPTEAKEYISFIEKEIGIPIKFISTSPERDDTIKK